MTTNEKNGIVFAWERVRYLTRVLSDQSSRRKSGAFEPGDIACCRGSIELVFYNHLKDLGIPLEHWEGEKPLKKPLRFCIIHKRFQNGYYEVFLMTTFGQVRTFDELGPLAQKYGVPVGGMNWFEDIRPIRTFPALFGWEGKSFIFAIPTLVKDTIPTTLQWTVRLVPGELERLGEISQYMMKNTERVHRLVRSSLSHRHYKRGATSISVDEEQDDFLPHEHEDINTDLQNSEPLPQIPAASSRPKVQRLSLVVHHDLKWLLNHASSDISNYSTYLNYRRIDRKGPIQLCQLPIQQDNLPQLRLQALPKPYYSPPLRININSISRMLR